jgi:hypothetical protein
VIVIDMESMPMCMARSLVRRHSTYSTTPTLLLHHTVKIFRGDPEIPHKLPSEPALTSLVRPHIRKIMIAIFLVMLSLLGIYAIRIGSTPSSLDLVSADAAFRFTVIALSAIYMEAI